MSGYRSGLCAHGGHGRCRGDFGTVACDCGCHTAPPPPPVLRVGELFAGYGGLGMGVTAALGGEVAWVSEIDPGASRILAHRLPGVPNHGDITRIDWATVEPVDVLTGGFPCQDVSLAGLRKGIHPDSRSGLWAQFAYAIDQLRPRLVVIENVRGLLSAEAHHPSHGDLEPCGWCLADDGGPSLRALGAVLGDLVDLGFDAEWVGLRAADVGAPHGRFRVFVTAWPAAGDAALRGRNGARPAGRGGESSRPTRGPNLTAAHSEGHGRNEGWPEPARLGGGPDAAIGSGAVVTHADSDGSGRLEELHGLPRTGGEGGSDWDHAHGLAVAAGGVDWGTYATAIHRWERVLGRPAPSPTQRGAKGQPRLSPRFVEWLMGLPAGWVCDVPGLSRNDQLKALGNGVVPQQAAAALRLLLADVLQAAA